MTGGARLVAQTRDASVAPLARILAVALDAAADPAWAAGLPPMDVARLAEGVPLIHGVELPVEPRRAATLLARLGGPAVDPLLLIEASLAQATERIAAIAEEAQVDADVLAIVGHALALPLLLACGRSAPTLPPWEIGYCPVCAAWPSVAEIRGLDRERSLRCGRCGTGWRITARSCAHCGESDHRKLGYLAPRDDRESRRAETCESCHAYLKSITVLAPTPPEELAALDMETIELDLAAIERGYGRPAEGAVRLEVRVIPAVNDRRWFG